MNNDFQNCPYCESTIKIGVKKCRFCWEFIDKRYEVPKIKNYIWGYTNPAFKKKTTNNLYRLWLRMKSSA